MRTLGDRIRALIDLNPGLSIERVARTADMPSSQLHRILNGNTKNPGVRTLGRIARGLQVTLNELVQGVDGLGTEKPTVATLTRMLIDAGRVENLTIDELADQLRAAGSENPSNNRASPGTKSDEPGRHPKADRADQETYDK